MDLLGLDTGLFRREPKRRRSDYTHKNQMEYFIDEDSQDFRQTYRFRKQTVQAIARSFESEIGPIKNSNHAFTTEQRLCIALKFYANGCFQKILGDSEVASQASVCRIIAKVSSVLANHSADVIKFSVDPAVIESTRSAFYGYSGRIPNCVGILDGTQIPLKAPYQYPEQYINRHQGFSISTQLIVNHRGAITFLSCRWPGSVHDSRALQESNFQDLLDSHILGNNFIMADKGYACQGNLLTPYQITDTPVKVNYNELFSKTRVKVEQVIGQWKRKFPVLSSTIQYQPEVVMDIIKACGFLWNVGIMCGDNQGFNPNHFVVQDQDDLDANLDPTEGGRVMRNKVAAYLWANR